MLKSVLSPAIGMLPAYLTVAQTWLQPLARTVLMRTFVTLLGLSCLSCGLQATLMPYESNPVLLVGDASPAQEEELIGEILNHPDDLTCEFIGKIPTEGSDDPYGFIARGLLSIDPSLDGEPMETMVDWDLTGTGWELCAVLVKADGHYDIYFPDDAVVGAGLVTGVTVPADEKTYAPSHITFMGRHVPDGGSTLSLMGCSLVGLAVIRRRKTHRRS